MNEIFAALVLSVLCILLLSSGFGIQATHGFQQIMGKFLRGLFK